MNQRLSVLWVNSASAPTDKVDFDYNCIMRPSLESVSRKSLRTMLYEELFIALRLQPSPQFLVPTLKVIRELSKEPASHLLPNHRFIETVDLIGKMQITGGFQRNKPKNAPPRIQTESGP